MKIKACFHPSLVNMTSIVIKTSFMTGEVVMVEGPVTTVTTKRFKHLKELTFKFQANK